MNTMQIKPNQLSTTLLQLIEQYNITEAHLARSINLPRATINRIKSGKITDPKSSTLTSIANYFNITIDQLLGHTPLATSKEDQISIIRVPLLEWSETINFKHIDLSNHESWVSFEDSKDNSQSLFALKIEGEAMWPYFDNDSIIIIDTNLAAKNRNFVVAYITKNKEVILRQLLIDGKSKVLNPINNLFIPSTLKDEDYIIGVVIQVKKNLTL